MASLELETEKETRPRLTASPRLRRPSWRRERGVEEGEIWERGVGMARVGGSDSMRAYFFFGMIAPLGRRARRTTSDIAKNVCCNGPRLVFVWSLK